MIRLRPNDPIRPDDDLVIRAGGGSVEALLDRALLNAEEYQPLVDAGHLRSPYTVSVNVPREGVATLEELLAAPPYVNYKPYLDAPAMVLLNLGYVEIVATTPVVDELTPADLCHYDVVVEAHDEQQLRERLTILRDLFARHTNPAYRR